MGLKLNLRPGPIWVSAAAPDFDGSEFSEFDAAERAKVRFLIAPAKKSDVLAAVDRNSEMKEIKTRLDGHTQTIEREVLNQAAFNYERLCAVLLDWSGLLDEAGITIPCTPENKTAFHDSFFQTVEAIFGISNRAAVRGENRLEQAEKN